MFLDMKGRTVLLAGGDEQIAQKSRLLKRTEADLAILSETLIPELQKLVDEGRARHGAERVQSVLAVDGVLRVASQGIDRSDGDVILSLLSLTFEPGEDGAGALLLTLAGDGAIRLEVEALDVTLRDVTRPYTAPSRRTPAHPD